MDFYIPEENMAIQVAYSIDGDAREREINNLRKLAKENPGARLMVVTYNEEETIQTEEGKIEVLPFAKQLSTVCR